MLAQGEESESPVYDYDEIIDRVDELDNAIRRVRHALHAFNARTVIPEEGVTIDEALIRLAQMNGKLRRLERLRAVEPKSAYRAATLATKASLSTNMQTST